LQTTRDRPLAPEFYVRKIFQTEWLALSGLPVPQSAKSQVFNMTDAATLASLATNNNVTQGYLEKILDLLQNEQSTPMTGLLPLMQLSQSSIAHGQSS
jgi:hypothetical protein